MPVSPVPHHPVSELRTRNSTRVAVCWHRQCSGRARAAHLICFGVSSRFSQRKRGSMLLPGDYVTGVLVLWLRVSNPFSPGMSALSAAFVPSWSTQAPGLMATAAGSARCRAGRSGLAGGRSRPKPMQRWWPVGGTAGSSLTQRCSSQSSAPRSTVKTSPRLPRWCPQRSVCPHAVFSP